MPLKQRLQHLKSTRTASVEFFKKRKIEASSLLNLAVLQINKNKLSTGDSSDMESEFGTWFWNKNANKIDMDSEKRKVSDIDKKDLEKEQSRIEQAVNPKVFKVEIQWNKKGK